MPPYDNRIIPARRSFRPVRIPVLVSLLFITIGTVIFMVSGDPLTLFFSGFGLLILLIVLIIAAAPGIAYKLDGEELVLKNSITRRRIPLHDIQSVALLDRQQTAEYMHARQKPMIAATRSYNLGLWWHSAKGNADLQRFLSIPLVTTTTAAGHENNITSYSVRTEGDYIFFETVEARTFLLTPKDPIELRDIIAGAGARQLEPTELIRQAVDHSSAAIRDPKIARGRRFIRIYMAAAFAVILTGVLVYLFIIDPSTGETGATAAAAQGPESPVEASVPPREAPAPEEVELSTVWVDDSTLRVHLQSNYFPPGGMEQEERADLLRQMGYLESNWKFAYFIMDDYLKTEQLTPEHFKHDQAIQALRDWSRTLPCSRVREKMPGETPFAEFVFQYHKATLREEAWKIIDEYR